MCHMCHVPYLTLTLTEYVYFNFGIVDLKVLSSCRPLGLPPDDPSNGAMRIMGKNGDEYYLSACDM